MFCAFSVIVALRRRAGRAKHQHRFNFSIILQDVLCFVITADVDFATSSSYYGRTYIPRNPIATGATHQHPGIFDNACTIRRPKKIIIIKLPIPSNLSC